MDPCPFVRVSIDSLALKLPFASKPAGSQVHPSSTPCFCKIRLHNFPSQTTPLPLTSADVAAAGAASLVFHLDPALLARINANGSSVPLRLSVYTGRMGATCGVPSRKLLGRVRVEMDLSVAETRACVYQSGWVRIGKGEGEGEEEEEEKKKKKPSARVHLVVRSEPDPRFVFQFGGEPECGPVVFQIQGNIQQPVFTCKFSADRNARKRSQQLDSGNHFGGWLGTFGSEKERLGRERKGWMVMIYDLSGSPVAAASMTTPFVPSPGSDRVSRSNPGAWLILRPHGFSVSSWKPWARLEAWREKSPIDSLGYKLDLITDTGPTSGTPIAESRLSIQKGGQFCIDTSMIGDMSSSSPSMRGFVMSSTVEGDGKISKPMVQVGTQYVTCMADAALFIALSAAIDLSMDACRHFSQKLRKELCHDHQDYIS